MSHESRTDPPTYPEILDIHDGAFSESIWGSDGFKTIKVSGQSDVIADNYKDNLTIAAGSNVTLTTNAAGDTLTIAASGGTYTAGTGLQLSGNQFSVTSLAVTNVHEAANQTAHLALTTQEGDVVVRTDENKSYVKNAGTAGSMADWTLLRTPTDVVLSVAGNTGAVTANQIAAAVEEATDSNTFTDADHLKLNAIEANATADQTDAEIRTAVGNASDSNIFTDALKSKLDAIEASATADQTNEEIQDIVGGMVSGNTESGITVTYEDSDGTLDFVVASQTDQNFTNADHTKLDSIEASADVTDATNVDAAGAVMNSDVDAKGDILAASADNTVTRLAIGSNDHVLTADSSTGTGLKWAAIPPSGEDNQNAFSTVAVSGQDNVAADTTTDTLNLAGAGSVTITTNASSDTVTITGSSTDATKMPLSGGTFTGDITINDNEEIRVGSDNDLVIVHDGSNGFIKETTGNLDIRAKNTSGGLVTISDSAGENLIKATAGSSVVLTYDGTDRVTTTNAGVTVAGTLTATLANDSIENAMVADDAIGIAELSAGGTASSSTYLRGDNTWHSVPSGGVSNIVEDTTPQLGGDLDANGNDIKIDDGDKLTFGNDSDVNFWFDNVGSFFVIKALNSFSIRGSGDDEFIKGTHNDCVKLYYNGSERLETQSGGILITGTTTSTAFSGTGTLLTALNATNIGSGTVPTARLGSGTADNTSFLRGDNTWQTIASGGLGNVVEDTTPQLGGDLDANGNDIDMGTNVITDAKVGEWIAAKTKVDGIAANANNYSHPNHTGDVTSSGDGATTIADDAVTYAKMQNVSATDRILGRDSSGAGIVEEIAPAALRTMINVEDGATADQSNAEIKTAYEANSDTNAFTDADHTKLDSIATGAEVNVQSDWNASSGDALILNKPTIPSAVGGASGVAFNDDVKAKWGTGNDLEIFHDGSHSRIKDVGTGKLILSGDEINLNNEASSAYMLRAREDLGVELYFNNNIRIETTSAGATITGVLTADLADNSIDSEHYVDGSVDKVHLAADVIDATKIADNAIDSEHYVDGSIDTAHIAADAITNAKIANDSIDSEHYVDASIDTAHIANLAVTGAKIANMTIDTAQITNNAITTDRIYDLNVTTAKIAADAITGAKIADDAVNSEHIANGACGADQLASNSVENSKVADDAIGIAELSATGTASSSVFLRGDNTWAAAGGASTGESYVYSDEQGTLSDTGSNTYAGYKSGESLTTGSERNTFYGQWSGNKTTSGIRNTCIGQYAGYNVTTGDENVLIGDVAAYTLTHQDGVVAVGCRSLQNNTATHMTAVGYYSLYSNVAGAYNVAYGAEALRDNTTGAHNTAVGYRALYENTTASSNTGIGEYALRNNTTGYNHVAVGYRALYSNTTSIANAALGSSALYTVTTGAGNNAFGYYALYASNASYGTAMGHGAGSAVTSGNSNTCFGYSAGNTITTGANNTCIGQSAQASSATVSNEITLGSTSVTKFRIPGINFTIKDTTATEDYVLTVDSNGEAGWEAAGGGTSTGETYVKLYSADGTANSSGGTTSGGSQSGTKGNESTYFGYQAGKSVTDGGANTLIGGKCGETLTSGSSNTAIGQDCLKSNSTHGSCTAVGKEALQVSTQNGLTAVGYRALKSNTTGSGNTAVGWSAGKDVTTATDITAVGYNCLSSGTGATGTTGMGYNCLSLVTSGSTNTAVGYSSMYFSTSAYGNACFGYFAGYANTTGGYNCNIGWGAGLQNSTGGSNTLVGTKAGYGEGGATTGSDNVAVGRDALVSRTSTANNVALGRSALYSLTATDGQTAVGYQSLYSNVSGSQNCAVGYKSAYSLTAGDSTAVGWGALQECTSGTANTCIGNNAGSDLTTGANNVFIGNRADQTATTASNCIVIGSWAELSSNTATNEIVLGTSSSDDLRCNDQSISALSDARDKTDIIDLPTGLDFVNSLRPVKFKWDTRQGNIKDGRYAAGFLAQDLQVAEKAAGSTDYTRLVSTKNLEKLEAKYGNLIPILVQAVKELSAKVNTLENTLNNG